MSDKENELNKFELIYLTNFLSFIEVHRECADSKSYNHHYYPKHCLDAILGRFDVFDMSAILEKLEKQLLDK